MNVHMNVRLHGLKQLMSSFYIIKMTLKTDLKDDLTLIMSKITCIEINCNKIYDKMHILYSDIIELWLQSADACIPKTGHKKHNNALSHNIPWWSEHMEHYASGILMVASPQEVLWSTP